MSDTRKHYVLGFLFNDSGSRVVLIRKNKPDWQAGKLNGCGGLIEAGESAFGAMLREAGEETAALTTWEQFAMMDGNKFTVACYRSFDTEAYDIARTTTSEKVVKLPVKRVKRYACISNLHWLIEMALDQNDGNRFFATITY